MAGAASGPAGAEQSRTLWLRYSSHSPTVFFKPSYSRSSGFVPASVDHTFVTVPISFLAAIQVGLFRNIGDVAYLPVATTGNLMRFLESTYDGFVERRAEARHAVVVFGSLILAFAGGALIGAVASDVWGVRAIWLPSGIPGGDAGLVHRRGTRMNSDRTEPGRPRNRVAWRTRS